MTALAKSNEPSMEEILASIRRIIADDHKAELSDKASAAATAPVAAPAPAEDVLDLAVEAKPELNEAVADVQGQDDIDLLFAEAMPEPEPSPAYVAPPPQPAAPAAPVVRVLDHPAVPQSDLLSAATSASIAGAFSSLSNTLLTGNARTLEDLVKDMMKPMLKTWLDDNLPSIVERLIKTEIERVARGGR